MNISRLFILRPIGTSLLMLAILLTGILAYQWLPLAALPEVDYPMIRVSTFYPGASSQVMASIVTAPLERQFGQIPGLDQMTSSSSSGASIITLRFDLSMTLDIAEQGVQAAINAASSYLPKDLPNPPIYNKVNPADIPVLTLALTSKTLPLFAVEDLAETRFVQKLSQLPGVGLVNISGGQRPAIRVQVNPTALAAYGLTLEEVRAAITAWSTNLPKGSFDGENKAYNIQANDQLVSSKDYQRIVIAYKNQAPIYLADVARVVEEIENLQQAAWMNDTSAVILNILRQPGSNVIEVTERVKKLLSQLSATLPPAVEVTILTDRTHSIRASVKEAEFELTISVALVVMVIFLFLRNLPATLIPSVTVPLSLVGTLSGMYFLGFSLNNLTLMALTIATGFVVDDAIVMIENISRHIEAGISPIKAAMRGAKQISFTIISLTFSLIAVLIPLLFMKDIIGRLFREFAMTISMTILISAFVSLTLTPMMCAQLLRWQTFNQKGRFGSLSEKILKSLIGWYEISLNMVFKYQKLTLGVSALTLIITGIFLYFIPKGFFPIQDTGIIQGISEAAQSVSFSAMAKHHQDISRIILEDPAVENLSSFIGIDGTNTTLNRGRFLITLKSLEKRDANVSTIINRLKEKLALLPGVALYMQPVQDLTIDDRISLTQYQYSLGATDPLEVSYWSKQMMESFYRLPELSDISSDLQNFALQTAIQIDRNTAARLGITTNMIDNVLYDAFGQRQIATIFTHLNQYHVILEILPELHRGAHTLDNIYFTAANGGAIPLSAITQVSQQLGSQLINRQSQFPVATLSFNLANNASLGNALQAINKVKEELQMPDSIQTNFEGTARIFADSLSNELWLILAAIVVVYIVLGILYESYIHPLTILSTLPSASTGALLALWITDQELSVIALIGIILLIGIVMKNAILMIDFALDLERLQKKSALQAISEACLLRFRPIVMTTLAAILGAFPLAFATGIGNELRKPLGIAIIGGLILSQLLTLYSTPVIYLAFDKFARKIQRRCSEVKIIEEQQQ